MIFNRICKALLIAAVVTLTAAPLAAASKSWETVKTERNDAKTVLKETEIEIKSASGVLIVSLNHSSQIKVFTILGRLVNSETLQAGTSQLQLPAHGIYIVKVGDITCKVAV